MSIDFRNMDKNNPQDREFGLKLMITLLVSKPGQLEFTETEISEVLSNGVTARSEKFFTAQGEKAMRFFVPSEAEVASKADEFLRGLGKALGLTDAEIEEILRDDEDAEVPA